MVKIKSSLVVLEKKMSKALEQHLIKVKGKIVPKKKSKELTDTTLIKYYTNVESLHF